MDGERTVESNGSRHTMPDEIMDLSAPLHRLERNIAQRVHSEVQREIREHNQTGCEAEPPDRHLIAKNVRMEHLKSGSPARDAASYQVKSPMSALGQKRTFRDVQGLSALPPIADIADHSGMSAALCLKRRDQAISTNISS